MSEAHNGWTNFATWSVVGTIDNMEVLNLAVYEEVRLERNRTRENSDAETTRDDYVADAAIAIQQTYEHFIGTFEGATEINWIEIADAYLEEVEAEDG